MRPFRTPIPARGVILGLKGSRNGDNTAIVAVNIEQEPTVWTLGLWERPPDDDYWRVPRAEVNEAIRKAFREYCVGGKRHKDRSPLAVVVRKQVEVLDLELYAAIYYQRGRGRPSQ